MRHRFKEVRRFRVCRSHDARTIYGPGTKEVVVRTKDKTEISTKPKDLRDGLPGFTLEHHKSVFDSPDRDGGLVGVAPDSREPPGQTTRQ